MAVHPTLRRLNADWAVLAGQGLPPGWAGEPALHGELVGDVLVAVRDGPDAVFAALLRCGDPLARRVVLQAMLGRVVRDAARDREHDLDDYVAELWLCISGYPLSRRPARIAANLALDTAKRVRARTRAVPVDPVRLAALPAPSRGPRERAGLVLARARRADLLDQASHAALALVYTRGLSGGEAARLLGLSPAALRQRCSRAVQRLAAHADDLVEVA